VFDHLQSAGLKLSSKKCFLFQRGDISGMFVTEDGVAVDPAQVQAVQDWPATTGVTEVKKSFLASVRIITVSSEDLLTLPILCISVRRRHIHLCGPVKLMHGTPVDLKHALTEAPLLSYPMQSR